MEVFQQCCQVRAPQVTLTMLPNKVLQLPILPRVLWCKLEAKDNLAASSQLNARSLAGQHVTAWAPRRAAMMTMRLLLVPLFLLAYPSVCGAADKCGSFPIKTGGERLDVAPLMGFVEVCSQDAALCRALTQGYPPSAMTVGYFVTADEWARFKKGALPGFTNYLIAQIAKSTSPANLPDIKAFLKSRQGQIPDHTKVPDVLKVQDEVNLGVIGESDDSIVIGKVAKVQLPSSPAKIGMVSLNAVFALGPRVLSLYSFREYRSAPDLAAAKAATTTWLQCLRAANPKGAGIATPQTADRAMLEISRSHIDANVPAPEDFDKFMRRDLTDYFAATFKGLPVQYELLRDAPTQSGVAYPKYYLWVTIGGGKSPQQRGAVRVAAIEKKRFEVSDFISEDAIKQDPTGIYRVFPAPVCEKINTKVAR